MPTRVNTLKGKPFHYFSPSAHIFSQNPRRRKSKFGPAAPISTVTQRRLPRAHRHPFCKISSDVQQRRRSVIMEKSSDPKKKREGKQNLSPPEERAKFEVNFSTWRAWSVTKFPFFFLLLVICMDFDVKFRVDLDWIQVGLTWYV